VKSRIATNCQASRECGKGTIMAKLPKAKPASKTLERITFEKNRAMDFFSRRELIAQTGHQPEAWPLVALKELVDNAIDACEDAGIAPIIKVKVDGNGIEVTDNGPGIPPDTVKRTLDYSVRVSSREAYISPCRGAQGNALKTLLAMAYVLDGNKGNAEIVACGTRHEITVRVDPVQQTPMIEHNVIEGQFVKKGTSVRIGWPVSACSILEGAKERFLQIAGDFTFLNPHLTLKWDWFGETGTIKATAKAWEKWLPGYPTSAHWYKPENLERLIAAHLSHGCEMLVREFVAQFDGFAGSGKQSKVLEATGLARQPLSVLMNGNDFDHEKTRLLLTAMQENSRPIKPARLGIVGETHLRARFAAMGATMETFKYRKRSGISDSIPWVFEAAFAWLPTSDDQRLITGVNWSPGILNPFRELGKFGTSLDSILEKQRAGDGEPVLLFLHLASVRVEFTDRGKSAVVIGGGHEDEE
jgi:DNA topoisomerase VI subunit B